jgi:hypothetical protein
MTLYNFEGTYKQVGAIGRHQKFSSSISANTPKEGMDKLRKMFYDNGYSHILFTSCKIATNGKKIPMMKALGLE